MTKRLLAFALIAGAALAAWLVLGRGDTTTTPTTTTTATTTTPETISVKAYFYRRGALVPVVVHVPKTTAVARAAARALLAGPPSGFSTAIPAGTRLEDVTLASGVATARFSAELADAPRTAQAQIVYTLTQFPTVKGVLIDADGSPVKLTNGAGWTAYTPVSDDTYVDLTGNAPILVETPKRDSTVSAPVEVSGTASVFEATLLLEVRSAGKIVETDPLTATKGAPDRGTFSKTLDLAPGKYELVLYEPSAADGSHLHTTTVEITVAP